MNTAIMSEKLQYTPWYNRCEWETVFRNLYSSDPCKRQQGLDRVLTWRCRSAKPLPGAIEATVALVRAQMSIEKSHTEDLSRATVEEICLLYSMAVMRFVTGVVEPISRSQNRTPKSVAPLLGVPDWIIDLRNASAHTFFSSVDVFESGVSLLLQWLKCNYWDHEIQGGISDLILTSDSTPPDENVSELLNQFCQTRLLLKRSYTKNHKLFKKMTKIMQDLEIAIQQNHEEVIRCLITAGRLLPNDDIVEDLTDSEKISEFIEPLLEIWAPVILILKEYVQTLLETLLLTSFEKDDIYKELSVAWVSKLIEVLKWKQKEMMVDFGIDIRKLIKIVMKHPSKYSARLIHNIASEAKPPLTEKQQNHLLVLLAIYTGAVDDSYVQKRIHDKRVYSVEAIRSQKSYTHSKKHGFFRWELALECSDWGTTPLGVVPQYRGEEINYQLKFHELRPVQKRSHPHVDESMMEAAFEENDSYNHEAEAKRLENIAKKIMLF